MTTAVATGRVQTVRASEFVHLGPKVIVDDGDGDNDYMCRAISQSLSLAMMKLEARTRNMCRRYGRPRVVINPIDYLRDLDDVSNDEAFVSVVRRASAEFGSDVRVGSVLHYEPDTREEEIYPLCVKVVFLFSVS